MKLNLPSTWTSQKMLTLFLVALSQVKEVKSGSELSRCLGIDLYNSVSNFAENIADKQLFCCSGSKSCNLATFPTQCRLVNGVQCNKIGQFKFCVVKSNSYSKSPNPAHLCGGTLGDIPITSDSVVGSCPDLEVVKNTLDSETTAPKFSWLCCDNGGCTVPVNVAIESSRTAITNCEVGQHSMICFNDNKGWTCTGNVSSNYNDLYQPMGSCVLQIPAPDKVNPTTGNSNPTNTKKTSPTNNGNVTISSQGSSFSIKDNYSNGFIVVLIWLFKLLVF